MQERLAGCDEDEEKEAADEDYADYIGHGEQVYLDLLGCPAGAVD